MMKSIFQNILRVVGVEWVIKTTLVSALEAVRELVIETETKWDDKIALAVIDGVILALRGNDPD